MQIPSYFSGDHEGSLMYLFSVRRERSAASTIKYQILTLLVSIEDVLAERQEAEVQSTAHDMVPIKGTCQLEMPITYYYQT